MISSDFNYGSSYPRDMYRSDNLFDRRDQGLFSNQPLSSGYSSGLPISYSSGYGSNMPLSYGSSFSSGLPLSSGGYTSGYSSGLPITSGAGYTSGYPQGSSFLQGGRRFEGDRDFDKIRYIDHPEMYHLSDRSYLGNMPTSYGGYSGFGGFGDRSYFGNMPTSYGGYSGYSGYSGLGSDTYQTSQPISYRSDYESYRSKPWFGGEGYSTRDFGDYKRYGGDYYSSRDFGEIRRPFYGGESYGYKDYGIKDLSYGGERSYTIPSSGLWDEGRKYSTIPSQGWKSGWDMDKWGSQGQYWGGQGMDKWGSQGLSKWGSQGLGQEFPNVDMYEDDNSCFVELDLPGYKKEFLSVDLRANDDVKQLIIKGEPGLQEGSDKGINYLQKERHVRPFNRILNLPSYVKSDEVEAKLTHGILKIKIPKGGNRSRVIIGDTQTSASPYLIKNEFSSDWKDQRAISSTQ